MPIVFPTPDRQPSIEELVERESRRRRAAQTRDRKRRANPPNRRSGRALKPTTCQVPDCDRGRPCGRSTYARGPRTKRSMCHAAYMREWRSSRMRLFGPGS